MRDRLEQALEMALAAGDVTLRYFRQDNFQVERKTDRSPVTIADREAEKLLRGRIAEAFPDDAIIGEEFGEQSGSSGYRWILDPIDGTKSFIFGVPLYGTLIGIEFEGRSVAGVVNMPALGECVYAANNMGCHYLRRGAEPVAARVSQTRQLAAGLFLTSQVDSFAERGAAAVFHELERRAYVTRTWGDCYGYLLLATGRAEAMVDPVMNVWDAAALLPILEEAGGTFTDWRGRPTISAGEGIGTNGHVLEEVLEITRPFAKPA
jgi:histidinol phosphatase-like enzyme (inositol monophosphatase family)